MDDQIVQALVQLCTPWLTDVARWLAAARSSVVVWGVVALAGLVVAIRCRAVVPLLAAGFSAVATGAVSIGLKHVIQRPRPPADLALVHAVASSMPSTSAAVLAAPCVVLVATAPLSGRARRALAVVALMLNAVIGVALVYLAVHWASDVVVGWLLAGVVGGAVVALVALLPARTRRSFGLTLPEPTRRHE